jgi:3-dehydroquinate dehydratase
MSAGTPDLRVSLFYSYSHIDTQHRQDMERILAILKRQGYLKDWSDAQITPGQSISAATLAKQTESDISAFIFSPDFFNSEECLKEWDRAKTIAAEGGLIFRVPIIVRPCPWQDFLGDDDVKALPRDGQPITEYDDPAAAWQEVYEGIKHVVKTLRSTFTPKPPFRSYLKSADLPSSKPMTLDDIFVFPRLTKQSYTTTTDGVRESVLSSIDQLRDHGSSVIHGQYKSGKTALAKHIVLSLMNEGLPVLFVDLNKTRGRLDDGFLREFYEDQFHGDYYLWQQKGNKTLVVDNMTEAPGLIEFILECSHSFSQIYIMVSSDVFYSFLMDEIRLASFHQVRIEALTLVQQETLIRNRLTTLAQKDTLTDGFVDHAEDRVDSVITSNKIVPRFPFFVLSILQPYDTPMPQQLSITSYGHCYYVFIIASLHRAGISESDDAINSAFNFAEHLALAHFLARQEDPSHTVDFEVFKENYRSDYFIADSLVSRLTHKEYGIITSDGDFVAPYVYYFFLGKRLATDAELAAVHIPDLCGNSYLDRNHLTLLFAIHHATDNVIIEEILLRTMVELDNVPIATLDENETSRFSTIISEMPKRILSPNPVEEERRKVRTIADQVQAEADDESQEREDEDLEPMEIGILRTLKNNRILGQVLRNQYGKLTKVQVEEMVETIAEGAFRLINVILKDEDEIRSLVLYVQEQVPQADLDEVQRRVEAASFLWTIVNIEEAVHAVNVPSIREAVEAVVTHNSSPAYDIFGYFYQLDSGEALTLRVRNALACLYRRHRDEFVKRVLSMRTQFYMNTHRSKTSIEQSVCSVLRIRYRPRLRRPQ